MLGKKLFFILIAVTLLGACSPASQATEAPASQTAEAPAPLGTQIPATLPPTEIPVSSSTQAPTSIPAEPPDQEPETAQETPDWFSAALTDVRSGQAFNINDFRGKVVLLETMAIWCSNCKKQQVQVKELHGLLGSQPELVSIGLDIDPNESAPDLKAYIENNGFDWTYAVSSPEVSREIANLYGDQFLNPPATPMLLVDRLGQVHVLPFGIKSAQELQAFIQPFLDASS